MVGWNIVRLVMQKCVLRSNNLCWFLNYDNDDYGVVGKIGRARFENRETRFVVRKHSRSPFHMLVEDGENVIGYLG